MKNWVAEGIASDVNDLTEYTHFFQYLNGETSNTFLNGVQGADIPSSKVQSAAAI